MEFFESLSSDQKNDVEILIGYYAKVAQESSRIFINELHLLNKSDSDKLKLRKDYNFVLIFMISNYYFIIIILL